MKQAVFCDRFSWIIPVLALALAAQGQAVRPATGPAGSIDGRVISPEGKPLAGVKVKAYDASRLFRLTPLASEPSNLDGGYPFLASTTTDASGHFHIDAPVLLEVIVAAQADGYGLVMTECATDGLDDPLTIPMAPAMTARVRVIDASGWPVPNAHVAPTRITSTNGTYIPYLPNELAAELIQVSDASGMCSFPGLPTGSRILYQVQDDLFTTSASTVNQPRADAQPGDVQDYQIEPAGVIEGQVIFSDTGKPAAGMVVLAGEMIGTNGRWTTNVTTDNQGTFRLAHVRRGEVQLVPRLTSPDSRLYTATITNVTINPSEMVSGQQLQLILSASSVRGQVTSGGVPVAGVTVSVVPDRTSVFENPSLPRASEATTAADGSYELGLTPGQYTLTASAADRLNLFPLAQRDQQINVTAANPTTADFQFQPGSMPPLGKVEGTVVDEQDHPVAGAAIVGVVSRPVRGGPEGGSGSGARPMAAVVHGMSDANGKFSMNVIGPAVELYMRKGNAVLPQPVMITPENRPSKLVLKETSGTLMLHALQANGLPVAGAQVRVGISYSWRRQFAPVAGITGADGSFAVQPFFPDRTYQVTISAADFANATQQLGTPSGVYLGSAIRGAPNPQHTVDPGRTLDVTMPMLKIDSFIAGQVVDPAGVPLPGVNVNARGTRGTSTYSTRTDASGRFRIDKLVAGEQLNVSTFSPGARSGQSMSVMSGTGDVKLVHDPSSPRAGGPRGIPATSPAARGGRQ